MNRGTHINKKRHGEVWQLTLTKSSSCKDWYSKRKVLSIMHFSNPVRILLFVGWTQWVVVHAFLSRPVSSATVKCTSKQSVLRLRVQHESRATNENNFPDGNNRNVPFLNHGLLFSSFSDGLCQNSQAQIFLKHGLAKALLLDQCAETEGNVESSVMHSPCNGPDIVMLNQLESVDAALETIDNHDDPMTIVAEMAATSSLSQNSELRFLYIPTAMYALRPDSINTPGKQRQRARADGKKRRDHIVSFLSNQILPDTFGICAVTMDLDDGSIKQPDGPNSIPFPSNGKEALTNWKPHLVYVEGGNTFWLEHCVDKGDWGDLLTTLATNPGTVYCGSSAGAILVGSRVETACWKGWDDPRIHPDRPSREDWVGVPGLDLIGGTSIFPHMDESWTELVAEKKQTLVDNVVCIRDEDVLCVQGATKTSTLALGLREPCVSTVEDSLSASVR